MKLKPRMRETSAGIGIHLLIDFYEVSPSLLTNATFLSECMRDAALAAGATLLSEPVLHSFPGGGLTGFIPLAESHIAIRTYPERSYMAADLFTCGAHPPDAALTLLRERLRPGRESVRQLSRGEELRSIEAADL